MVMTVKHTFDNDLETKFSGLTEPRETITDEKIAHLPTALKKYLEICNLKGLQVPKNASIEWAESYIKLSPEKKWLRLKTIQYNQVDELMRIAYMKALFAGIIPFEGRDIYYKGKGHMLGKLGKIIPIFNEGYHEIAQSALITCLAEFLLVPGYIFQPYVTWEEIDTSCVKATLKYHDLTVTGYFYFNEKGEYIKFVSHDRYYLQPDKTCIKKKFTVLLSDYIESNSVRHPSNVKVIWNLDERDSSKDYEYWKGSIKSINYNINI
jgi:hypothetical protein